jgi:lysophospholipase L1-like esterase
VAGSHREPDPDPGRAIVFYGSSSIRLWPDLAADLGDPRIVNLGFGGSTLADCVHYFERLVVPHRPGSVVLYAGENDLGQGRSPPEVLASFRDLTRKLDAHLGPIRLAFLSIKPSPARWPLTDAIRATNDLIRQELTSRPNTLYLDLFGPMLGPDGRPRAEFYAVDGLHLSAGGYRLWAGIILSDRGSSF